MAAKSAIGIKRNDAMARIEAALPGFEMPRQGRDEGLLHAQQLEAIAEYLEAHTFTPDEPVENAASALKSLEVGPVGDQLQTKPRGKGKSK